MPAIYYQIISAAKEEFDIVNKCLVRERFMQEMKELIKTMDLNRDAPTEQQLLDTIRLFIEIRRSTINLLRSINKWQQCFSTIGRRPQLMEKDYILGMVSDSDIFGNAKARKYLNFTLGTGNILLLPRQSVTTKPPVKVSQLLYDRLQIFNNPSEAEIRDSYQVRSSYIICLQASIANIISLGDDKQSPTKAI
jgi:hypothetical protein